MTTTPPNRRPKRLRAHRPDLTVGQILAWADAHHGRTGTWPNVNSGDLPDAAGENWRRLDMALRRRLRGLPSGSSLARLLAGHRGVHNLKQLPALTEAQILAWADAHHAHTGRWPTGRGPVLDAPGETWVAVQVALTQGRRGLPGGSSLGELLARRRGVRNHLNLPRLTEEQVLAWADAHHARTGCWPRADSGPVLDAPGQTWGGVDGALQKGLRGLAGGSSLPRLLAGHRGVRNRGSVPRLTVKQILAWADAFRARTRRWPTAKSGPIPEAPEETWMRVTTALREGLRGLPGGSSLARLLREHRPGGGLQE
jgi:hypothetical protein